MSLNSRYARFACVTFWNGRDSFLMATLCPVVVSSAALHQEIRVRNRTCWSQPDSPHDTLCSGTDGFQVLIPAQYGESSVSHFHCVEHGHGLFRSRRLSGSSHVLCSYGLAYCCSCSRSLHQNTVPQVCSRPFVTGVTAVVRFSGSFCVAGERRQRTGHGTALDVDDHRSDSSVARYSLI